MTDARTRERISFGGILRSLRRAIVDFDFDAIRTVVGLARRPGATVRHYFGAGRADLLNPVKFALLTSTLYVVVNLWTQQSEVAAIFDPIAAAGPVWPYVSLLLLLPVALVQRLLFRGRDVNAAECYAFWLFLAGAAAIVATLHLLLRLTTIHLPATLLLPFAAAYVTWATIGLYQDRSWTVWLRALSTFVVAVALLGGLLYAFQWYRFSGFEG